MSEKNTCPIELYDSDVKYLEEMAKKYDLPDVSKAIRCLINFAREEQAEEKRIFEEIRCGHC